MSESDDYVNDMVTEEITLERKYKDLMKRYKDESIASKETIEQLRLEIRQLQAAIRKLNGQFVSASELAGDVVTSEDVLDQLLK